MSQAANFTIKDGATTPADTVFTNVKPAVGQSAAEYYARAKGPSPALQPKVKASDKATASSRVYTQIVETPYWVTGADGVSRRVDAAHTVITTTLPTTIPDAVRNDHYAYVANSVDVAQFQDGFKNGYAPG